MLSLEWSLLFVLIAGWFVSMLMNGGEFETNYFFVACIGALLFPYAASFAAQYMFHRDVHAGTFAGLQPRCAGAFIACLLFDSVKGLTAH